MAKRKKVAKLTTPAAKRDKRKRAFRGVTVARRFRALKTFHSEEFASDYVAGLEYTIHRGNKYLAKCVKRWVEEGKVEYVDKPADISVASGRGEVE